MSKSLGNGIPPDALVERYGVDPARYFLLRELPFGSDGDFSHRAVVGRLQRRSRQRFREFGAAGAGHGQPRMRRSHTRARCAIGSRHCVAGAARGLLQTVRGHVSEQAFHLALEAIWRVVGEANRYVDEQAPWVLRRSDPVRMKTVLYTLAETIRHLAVLVQPFVPGAAVKLLDQLAVPETARSFAALEAAPLIPGTPLPTPEGVFPRFVELAPGKAGGMLVDSHCHLDFPDFAAEREAIIGRARSAGVETMLTICTRLDEFDGCGRSPRHMTRSGARSVPIRTKPRTIPPELRGSGHTGRPSQSGRDRRDRGSTFITI